MVKVALRPLAKSDLAGLPRPVRRAILSACQELLDDWGIGKVLSGPLSRYRMHRVGMYRIIYMVRQNAGVEIVAIGHREDVYERAARRW